ncbi:MAG: DMT family transporter [Pseudomonadota bacterium]
MTAGLPLPAPRLRGRRHLAALAMLLAVGTAWGVGTPLWKIAAETGHDPLGLTIWQIAAGLLVLVPLCALRRVGLPLGPAYLRYYAGLALIGVLLPTTLFYIALREISAGVGAIIVATVPMLTLLMATALGLDRPTPRRLAGVGMGFVAVLLILSPDSLPSAGSAPYLLLALLASASYAAEGNWISLRAPQGLDPVATLLGASLVALLIALPLGALSGHIVSPFRPWGPGEWALNAVAAISALAYSGYIWLVGRTGPVFAAQVGYVVTLCGVFWSMLVLDERYTGAVWAALFTMLAGLALVRPRNRQHDPAHR